MLKIQDLVVSFGGLIAVNDVNFEVSSGEIYGLIGPNGAGKTTVFNAVSGAIKPTSGHIFFCDEDISGLAPYEVNRHGIARTYQNINIFKKMTCIENTMVGRHSVDQANLGDAVFHTKRKKEEEKESIAFCEELLAFVGLAEKRDFLASSLPYGEQRKLEIARAMASEPKLLLLDEPAAGMNQAEKNELSKLIKRINKKGITVLLVEHNMKLVMGVCDRLCVLNYGKVIAKGKPDEISVDPVVIDAYLGGTSDD